MPLPMKNTAPPRELPAAENHHAICVGHYHIGTQHSEKYNKDDNQIILSFAVLDEKRSDGSYFFISAGPLTLSFDNRSNLTKIVKGWLGRVPEDGEEFDTSTLVDKQCLITIVHDRGDNGTVYANIQSVSPLPRSMPEASYDGDTRDYSPIDPTKPLPDWVPEWIGRKIQQSLEWQAVHGKPKQQQSGGQANGHQAQANGAQPNGGHVHPSKAPLAIRGYCDALTAHGLTWPYDDKELDVALANALRSGEDGKTITELEVALRPHCIPF